MSKTTIVPRKPIRFSVTASNLVPSSLNSTRLTAVLKSQTLMHFPVRMSHNRTVLSAAPEARSVVDGSTSMDHRAPWWPWYVPNRSPLAENQAHMIWSLAQEKRMSPSLVYLFGEEGQLCELVGVCRDMVFFVGAYFIWVRDRSYVVWVSISCGQDGEQCKKRTLTWPCSNIGLIFGGLEVGWLVWDCGILPIVTPRARSLLPRNG